MSRELPPGITINNLLPGFTATERLMSLRRQLAEQAGSSEEAVQARWEIWRREKERRRQETGDVGLSSAYLFDALERHIPDDAILPVDVGNNTYSFGRYFECTQQSVLMSGYLGSIGFAFPAAMGAWTATQQDDPR